MKKIGEYIKKNKTEAILFLFAITFSIWLMFSTFSYSNGNMLIASKAWSDFASHIPLIRSFSLGDNFPPQYPLFAGPPIRYHFLFYALAGLLEKTGLRIDVALNLPSIIGFTALILGIYFFARYLFKSKLVGLLSVLFFLFNGSLEFIKFFQLHPLSLNSLTEITKLERFVSFGPYDSSIVSAFWNLNIYTNQRHLALSYALSLLLVFLVLRPYLENKKTNLKVNILAGILLGLSFFLNIAVFIMTSIIFLVLFLIIHKNRLNVFISLALGGIIALPQYLFMQTSSNLSSPVSLYLGYLANNNLSLSTFINYWFQNLGLHLILIPLGFIFAPKKVKYIFLAFFALFIVGNVFKFSPEVAANHKFFNYFLIVGVMFSAYLLTVLWKKKNYLKPAVIILIFFLIFSGIMDFFPIYNDSKITLNDYPQNKDIIWLIKNTKPNSIFLNTQYLYDNASLAGRKVFMGWPYFPWSAGYDTNQRGQLRDKILTTNNKTEACNLLKNNNINYVEINSLNPNNNTPPLSSIYTNKFVSIYKDSSSGYELLDMSKSCL